MKAGDRVSGLVEHPGIPVTAVVPDSGTVAAVYEGGVTGTPYALVRWDREGLHVARQEWLTVESVTS